MKMQLLINRKPSEKYGPMYKALCKGIKRNTLHKDKRDYNVEACGYYRCRCAICNDQAAREYSMTPITDSQATLRNKSKFKTKPKNQKCFFWLIEHLISTHERIHGCEVRIPETYFLFKGRVKFMIKTDKNGCLSMINIPEKLEFTEIRKDLPVFVRNRKINKNNQSKGAKVSTQSPKAENDLYSPDIAYITYFKDDQQNLRIEAKGEKEFLDIMNIRK